MIQQSGPRTQWFHDGPSSWDLGGAVNGVPGGHGNLEKTGRAQTHLRESDLVQKKLERLLGQDHKLFNRNEKPSGSATPHLDKVWRKRGCRGGSLLPAELDTPAELGQSKHRGSCPWARVVELKWRTF